ncbi:hypothetical protein AB1K84_15495 [Mesobacillus foraminis]|uniref:hypothetical protein n=1 Tax=Mesobacillus foraminis TaxID=279826 RepID=UPI0039A13F93
MKAFDLQPSNLNNPDLYIEKRTVVDTETGELFPQALIIAEPDKVVITKKATFQSRKDFLERKNRKGVFEELAEGFTFTYISKISELHEDERFTDDEKTRIMFLGTYVSYSKKGSFLTFSNGRLIYKHNLKTLLEISSDNKFYSFYNKLVETGIITEVPEGSIKKLKWSNEYHFKGKLPKGSEGEASYIKTYDKQIQELYKAKNSKEKALHSPKQLYTVFMLLPFVHYETNLICKFPNKPFTECEPLDLNELAKGLGFNRSNDLKRKLMKISLKEQPVFQFNITNKGTHITVNPFIVWRQNKLPDDALLVTFFDTARRIAEGKGIKITMKDLIKINSPTRD